MPEGGLITMKARLAVAYILETIFGIDQEEAERLSQKTKDVYIDRVTLEWIAMIFVPRIYAKWLYHLLNLKGREESYVVARRLSSAFLHLNERLGKQTGSS